MAERDTAERQLERLLYLLPAARRPEGVALAELAQALEVEPARLLRDLQEVTARAYYHPAGTGEDVQVLLEATRVSVWTKGEFARPVRLNAREALALSLGLRALAAEAGEARREELLRAAARLEGELARAAPEALLRAVAVARSDTPGSGARLLLAEAARERRTSRISYLKPGEATPEDRTVDPYALVYASARWYLLARCHRSDAVRVFRLERVLEASVTEDGFEVPEGFDVADYLEGGYVFRAQNEVEVVVRYAPRIARWIRELGPVEECADGGVVLRHRVADPGWVVRHVLGCGGEAVVVEPREVRLLVANAARRILGPSVASN